MPVSTSVRGREYLRVSKDKSGRERSPHEQHQEHLTLAEAESWTLGDPYLDVGSASRFATKSRADFDRLITDLKEDRFGADFLIIWESSRGSRRVSEWALLIDLLEDHGLRVYVTSHRRFYDPAEPRDRRSMMEDAVDAEYESGKTSVRVKRAMADNARTGAPHGKIPYGYQRTYHERTRRLISQDPHPEEAPIVRELFARIRKGHTLYAIAADFERRGVRTRQRFATDSDTGEEIALPRKAFAPKQLRDMALNRTYVGERVHDPDRGTKDHWVKHAVTERGVTTPGRWPALVSRAEFLAVQRILTAAERKTVRPGRAVHLLSMIAQCDVCGSVLTARLNKDPDPPTYVCRKRGCVSVAESDLDTYAEDLMIGYLARPDLYEQLSRRSTDPRALGAVRDEIATIRTELDDLAEKLGSGALSATLAAAAEPGIRRRLAAAEARERALSTPDVLTGVITPGENVAASWADAPMSARRIIARLLLSRDYLGALRVAPTTTPGRHCPAHERVKWDRAG